MRTPASVILYPSLRLTSTPRWLRSAGGCALSLLTFVTYATTGNAEAGAPYCRPASPVEIFAGAPGCEDAAYVVIQLDARSAEPGLNFGFDLYLAGPDDTRYVSLDDVVSPDAGAGTHLLIGTPSVAAAFGVTPDVTLDDLPLTHYAGVVELCHVDFAYHANAGSHMCAGDALRLEEGTWVNATPDPKNAGGQTATRWNCAAAARTPLQADGGTVDARTAAGDAAAGNPVDGAVGAILADAGPSLCDPRVFEPPPEPSSAEAGLSAPPEPVPGLPIDAGSLSTATLESTSLDAIDATTPASSSPGTDTSTAVNVSAPPAVTSADDAGSSTPASPQDSSDGCGCRVGSASESQSSGTIFAFLAASVGLLRRRPRLLPRAVGP